MRILANEKLMHGKTEVQLHAETYAEGGAIALDLSADSGEGWQEPYARLTCNLDVPPPPNCVWLKEWSENEWVYQWCVANGLIEAKAVTHKPSGYVLVHAYRLSDKVQKAIIRAASAEKRKVQR